MRDRKRGTLTISQQSFARELVNKFDVTSVQNIPLRVGLKLDEFDVDEKTENRPFREGVSWVGCGKDLLRWGNGETHRQK